MGRARIETNRMCVFMVRGYRARNADARAPESLGPSAPEPILSGTRRGHRATAGRKESRMLPRHPLLPASGLASLLAASAGQAQCTPFWSSLFPAADLASGSQYVSSSVVYDDGLGAGPRLIVSGPFGNVGGVNTIQY